MYKSNVHAFVFYSNWSSDKFLYHPATPWEHTRIPISSQKCYRRYTIRAAIGVRTSKGGRGCYRSSDSSPPDMSSLQAGHNRNSDIAIQGIFPIGLLNRTPAIYSLDIEASSAVVTCHSDLSSCMDHTTASQNFVS